ncbi:IIGP5 GTPase, partial [Polyodon spathula]|nr:interferon-inducible GTPase 5-like [Polyodon spathula]XP_041082673.1 interferon-inducible GTPase 5-like [Polyodon spathula]XP_041082674.1 interferon-inducible GTPase 5-like [Polyodon spathula]MBN3283995.1 IIGP5 GTPase [Polyodon spathula]
MTSLQTISEKELGEMSALVQSRVLTEVVSQVQTLLNKLGTASLDIAVTGESGAGKSTFINAFRGLGDEDKGSAKTGVIETTRKVAFYQHPSLPTIRLWDLPGIGTPDFRPESYLEDVNLERYDFFIIVASERFKENHALLARSIESMGKKFYFVRSKLDSDLASSQRQRPSTFTEAGVLDRIRGDCVQSLERMGARHASVFLISSFEPHKYDFTRLRDTLERELEGNKRHVFLLALPNLSCAYVEKKKQALSSTVWKTALSACLAAVVPGAALHCNMDMLMQTLRSFQQHFGLDTESLRRLANRTEKPYEALRAAMRSSLAEDLSEQRVVELLRQAALGQQVLTRVLESRVPVLGNIANGGVSFAATHYILSTALNELADDAKRVIGTALEEGKGETDPEFQIPDPGFSAYD